MGHTLAVTETALAFVQDARRCGDVCQPLDWIPEVHHPLGSSKALVPDALLYYRHGSQDSSGAPMLRAFVEIDRATMGPERLASKISAYERLYRYVPVPVVRPLPGTRELPTEEWRHRYPVFPRVLFVLDGTGPTGIDNRLTALHAGAKLARADFLHNVPILAALLTDLLQDGPSAPLWRPVTDPSRRTRWMDSPGI